MLVDYRFRGNYLNQRLLQLKSI